MESEPMLTPREKSLLPKIFSSEEGRTHNAAWSRTVSPTHYQQAIPAPLLPFDTTFSDLNVGWGSQGQLKVKAFGFIFSHTFYLIQMEYDLMLKQFKLNIWYHVLREFCWIRGSNCCSADYIFFKNSVLSCIQTFVNQFSSNLVWWQIQHFDAGQSDLDPQGHSHARN